MKKCKGKLKNGKACSAHAGSSGYCWAHDPKLARKRAQAHKRGGRNSRHSAPASDLPEDADPTTAQGLQKAIATVFLDTWKLENSVARARALAYLASVQKSIIEVGELEGRIEALEQAIAKKPNPKLSIVK